VSETFAVLGGVFRFIGRIGERGIQQPVVNQQEKRDEHA